jgi:hypothetical protein
MSLTLTLLYYRLSVWIAGYLTGNYGTSHGSNSTPGPVQVGCYTVHVQGAVFARDLKNTLPQGGDISQYYLEEKMKR